MARNLAAAGADLMVWNRSPGPARALAKEGIAVAKTVERLAEVCDVIVVIVSDTEAVRKILFSGDGVTAGLKKGALVIDMGTTDVLKTRQFARWIAEAGGEMLDAPVSGGEVGAKAGELTIMVGGSARAYKKALPVFKVLGKRVTHVGDVSAGQVAKAANQVIVGLTIGAVSEALALAEAAGVDPARVRDAIRGGFAESRILELHGERMVTGKFTPGGKVRTQRKDMVLAEDLADEFGIDLPSVALNRKLYDKAVKAGHGDLDHSALFKLYKKT